jgi:hypothetical protein
LWCSSILNLWSIFRNRTVVGNYLTMRVCIGRRNTGEIAQENEIFERLCKSFTLEQLVARMMDGHGTQVTPMALAYMGRAIAHHCAEESDKQIRSFKKTYYQVDPSRKLRAAPPDPALATDAIAHAAAAIMSVMTRHGS